MHQLEGRLLQPEIIALSSCPNYCSAYRNSAAILFFTKTGICLNQFDEVPAPFEVLPDNLDALNFGLPYIAEVVLTLLLNLH